MTPASPSPRRVPLPLIGLAALLLAAVPARAEEFGDIVVTAQTPPSVQSVHGYAHYSFRVTNRAADQSHRVTLQLPDRNVGSGEHIAHIRRTVNVAPGASLRVNLLQPPLPMEGRNVAVRIDGQRQQNNVTFALSSFTHMASRTGTGHFSRHGPGSGSAGPDIDVLISPAINRSNLVGSFDRAVFGDVDDSSSRSNRAREFIQSNSPTEAWPERWLAYSRYDGVMLPADQMQTLPGAVRAALTRYVEAGGTLVVLGDWTPPDRWTRRTETTQGHRVCYLGFGKAIVSSVADPLEWTSGSGVSWTPVREAFEHTRRRGRSRRSVSEAHDAFPVVDELGVPVRGMFGLMIVFAVLIGPVNLLVLNRMNRRIWLLWTVPAVSLLFCGAVFAYNVLAEGWTPRVRTQLITILDQPARRAASLGWTACYAPLTPSDGLRFADDTELTPQTRNTGRRGRNGGRARTVDWSAGQHLASGWVTARVPAHFTVRRAHTERRRVEFQRNDDGTVTATNGLGVDIRNLRYRDPDGRIHAIEGLPAGAEAELTRAGRPNEDATEDLDPDDLRRVYAMGWIQQIQNWARLSQTREPTAFVEPLVGGDYLAVLEDAPFLDPGLDGAEIRQAPSVVYGITEHANQAANE